MSELHPIDDLFNRLKALDPYYPSGVVPVPQLLQKTAFFPGGPGLWGVYPGKPWPPMPVGGVMVLGRNVDNKTSYEDSLRKSEVQLKGATWRYLVPLLDQASIPKDRCFFTNFYMGLIDGESAAGPFPGKGDADFVQRCQEFLREQFRVMQPKLILILGKEFFNEFATFLPPQSQVKSVWMKAKTWQYLDENSAAFISPVTLPEVSHPVVVVALIDPSHRPPNVGLRRYKNLAGEAAELALLRDALTVAGTI